MRFVPRLLLLALVAILTAQCVFAEPCVPFPGAWTGDPDSHTQIAGNWVGLVYDHNSGCDSPVIGATFNLRTTNNESSIQIYIAERWDNNLTVGEPHLLFDSEVGGDGTFQDVSFGTVESVNDNDFVLRSGAQYLVIIKATPDEDKANDEEVGVDNESGYSTWTIAQPTLPGNNDVWTPSANSKARVWFRLMPSCYGILADHPDVCNSNGQCVDFDQCACNTGYEPPYCNTTSPSSSSSLPSSSDLLSSSSGQPSQHETSDDPGAANNIVMIVLSIVGAVIVILVILVIVVVVIVAVVAGVIYYQQHRYPLPRTYSRPFAEMPGKDTEFSPMAI